MTWLDCSVTVILQETLETVRDTVSEHLDSLHGADITDNSIFFDLPRKFEDEFFSDMERLNVNRLIFNFLRHFICYLDISVKWMLSISKRFSRTISANFQQLNSLTFNMNSMSKLNIVEILWSYIYDEN